MKGVGYEARRHATSREVALFVYISNYLYPSIGSGVEYFS